MSGGMAGAQRAGCVQGPPSDDGGPEGSLGVGIPAQTGGLACSGLTLGPDQMVCLGKSGLGERYRRVAAIVLLDPRQKICQRHHPVVVAIVESPGPVTVDAPDRASVTIGSGFLCAWDVPARTWRCGLLRNAYIWGVLIVEHGALHREILDDLDTPYMDVTRSAA